MKRKILSLLLLSAVISMLVLSVPGMSVSASTDLLSCSVTRIGGANRYETSAMISSNGWPKADNAVICSGESFADALAGVPLARALDAPILLVSGNSLSSPIRNELDRLGVSNIYVIGGESAVSSGVFSELSSGRTAVRICGSDRYGTSEQVARKLCELKGSPSQIFVVSAANYPDALAGSPVAAITGSPIIFIRQDGTLPQELTEYVRELCDPSASVSDSNKPLGSTVTASILGGTSAVSDNAIGMLKSCGVSDVIRVSGADRYATAIAIYSHYSSLFHSDGCSIATGSAFPDALSGAALAAKLSMPILLINNQLTTNGLYNCLSGMDISRLYVFGGTGAVSDYALNCLRSNTTMTTTTTAKPTTKPTSPNAKTPTVTITASRVNVRDGANSSTILGSAYKGETYKYYGTATTSDGVKWHQIEYKGKIGYVYGNYANVNGPITDEDVILKPDYISPYYLVVYIGSQSVIAYGKDSAGKYTKIARKMVCSTGLDETPTLQGLFSITKKYRWQLMKGDVYVQYACRWYPNYLFHSILYKEPKSNTLFEQSYLNLGKKASHGCVRLSVRDSKWIYDNCPYGTQVHIVSTKGPAGSALPSLRSGSKFRNWEPTDPVSSNPYNG